MFASGFTTQTFLAGTMCMAVLTCRQVAGEGSASASANPKSESIARLLDVGTTPGKSQIDEAERRYREALAIAPRDPRLEYAYSLILQKLFKSAESRVHLDRALEMDPDYPPARQALIREAI